MNADQGNILRLQFLARVVEKECRHLAITNDRLFGPGFGLEQILLLEKNSDLAERVEAFFSRFSRLQDTIGDKLVPSLLIALGEKASSTLDNLDRAERLEFLGSAEEWMAIRKLRNQMVHEYDEDPSLLADALKSAHAFVPDLISSAKKMIAVIEQRGWLPQSRLERDEK